MRHWATRCTLFALIAVLALSCLLTACGGGGKEEPETYEVRISSQMPIGHHITDAIDLFCERAEELSNGKLVFHHFPAGQLLSDTEVPEAISTGTIEMAQTFLPWWEGMVPHLNLSGAAFLDDLDHYYRLHDPEGPYEQYRQELLEETGNAKMVAPLLYCSESGYILTSPVHEPQDAAGMSIRTPSQALSAEIGIMGAAAVVMSSADVYLSLQRGTLDGAYSGLTSFYSRKYYEVAKYVTVWNLVPTDFHIVANLDWWNALPEDLQQAMINAGQEATEYAKGACLESEAACITALEAEGVEVYFVPQQEREDVWRPLMHDAIRDVAVAEHGEDLVSMYEGWVEDARQE
ncbi:MAG: TRAP transporter substrate-binding protein DctP [Chloroflexota bacterium]|nr:TRAP transporter substrate-binding protein DctP [Chloroflexota bacterium]